MSEQSSTLVRWFEDLGSGDVASVGGKNASLGEMISALADRGVRVPGGFATTASAFRAFIEGAGLRERIDDTLRSRAAGDKGLAKAGRSIRKSITDAELPEDLREAVAESYAALCERREKKTIAVAVRSSATAEDLPEASFAGQQETFLNVRGREALLDAVRRCFASLFTDRAIAYREEHGFDHSDVALSVGVQEMVRADKAGAGVMFTIDTESGFPGVVVIDAAWGLGETVVGGEVNPDGFVVFKALLEREGAVPIIGRSRGTKNVKAVYGRKRDEPIRRVETSKKERASFVLDESEVLRLARWGVEIEKHYGRPMDIEWAKDGKTGELFVVQARPETVRSRERGALKTYRLLERGEALARGAAVGDAIAAGRARVLTSPDQGETFERGEVLVAEATDPDWGPIMERAAAVVTDKGGRTAHAAIVSRELGIPAIVGAGDATSAVQDGAEVTVSCAEGEEGVVYDGALDFEFDELNLDDLPETRTPLLMNIASPAGAMRWHRLPVKGVGLARIEFVIANVIKIHPMALARFDEIEDKALRKRIEKITAGYDDKAEYFVDQLSQGVARIAASRYPDPVIVRLSDFKTNEYATLIGGERYEPEEENPMLGFRGASRYASDQYRDAFALECAAVRRVRERMGLENVVVMVPFCRTLEEADGVLKAMGEHGLARGKLGLKVYMMAEIPSNVMLAEDFAERFDGFSIGSNDLTQLTLGIDRDSALLAGAFDERNEAVKRMIRMLIEKAHAKGVPVGICGQAPSDHPDFAAFLVDAGIDTISLNPDSVVPTLRRLASIEREGAAAHG